METSDPAAVHPLPQSAGRTVNIDLNDLDEPRIQGLIAV